MKRLVLLTGVLIAVISFQSIAQIKIDYGVKAGLNVSGLSVSSYGKIPGVTYNNRTGFHLGGYATFRKKKWGLQPEVIYSTQGQNFSANGFSNLKTQLNYINVPVLVKYYVGDGFQIFAGPQMGILAGASGDINQIIGGNFQGQPKRNQDIKSYANATDFSIAFGFEIKLPAGLNLNFRYTSGLNNANKYLNAQTFPNDYQTSMSKGYTRNQVIQISVGYSLAKKKK